MILVDTSVWVDHLRKSDVRLGELLNTGKVLCHPFVIGELALGMLKNRAMVIASLQDLPQAEVAELSEIMQFIDQAPLYGRGVGFIDAHLLASARLTGCLLWTRDARLKGVAAAMGLSA
jgi:predicted nucleic acid-binding protein